MSLRTRGNSGMTGSLMRPPSSSIGGRLRLSGRGSDSADLQELVGEEERSDQEVEQVLEKRGTVLLVHRVADRLEDPSREERGDAGTPVSQGPGPEVEDPEDGEHYAGESHVQSGVIEHDPRNQQLRDVRRSHPEG